jgi:hypothetical protein
MNQNDDSLNAARGICIGLAICACLWVVCGLIGYLA